MQPLNRNNAANKRYPERIIQFGEGNFLRAFVDWIVWNMNEKAGFNSGVVVVQPIERGMVDMLNAQDGLYHLNLQGIDKGQEVDSIQLIDVISRGLNPYTQFDEYLKLAENPDIRFVISYSTEAGIAIDPRTNGAVVYENMETPLPGVFACGNVAHVHDLVDFVTAESQRAGAAAADYVLGSAPSDPAALEVHTGDGVTYTVPQHIRPNRVAKNCDLFFRVNRICGDSQILVKSGDTLIARFPREHLAPGEMEHIVLPKVLLERASEAITVSIQEVESK